MNVTRIPVFELPWWVQEKTCNALIKPQDALIEQYIDGVAVYVIYDGSLFLEDFKIQWRKVWDADKKKYVFKK